MKKNPLKIFNELIESLNQAEGAASQLVHDSGHPVEFIVIRDTLSLVKEGCMDIAPHNEIIQPKIIRV